MLRRTGVALLGAVLASIALPGVALAQDEPSITTVAGELNTVWILVAAVLVMFMQAGFAFLEIGFSRGKNAGMGIAKIVANFSIASIAWWGVGFALAFGGGGWLFGDSGFFFAPGGTLAGEEIVGVDVGLHALPVHVLRRVAGDRLGDDARAHQVQRVRDLRRRLRGRHLPADRPLHVGRRLPGQHRRTACRTSPARPSCTSWARPARWPRSCCSARARASTALTASRGRSPATRCRSSASAS